MAPQVGLEPTTLRLTAGQGKNLSAVSSVAYRGVHPKSRPQLGYELGYNNLSVRASYGVAGFPLIRFISAIRNRRNSLVRDRTQSTLPSLGSMKSESFGLSHWSFWKRGFPPPRPQRHGERLIAPIRRTPRFHILEAVGAPACHPEPRLNRWSRAFWRRVIAGIQEGTSFPKCIF
jgi:hypothetical protein